MKLVIHIGSHRAGSSAIQKYFSSNGEKLAKQGIHYPIGLFPRFPNQHSELARMVQASSDEDIDALAGTIARQSAEQGAEFTLLSGGDICAQARLEDARRIFTAFGKRYSSIRIALILRNRRDYLLSHFNHYLRLARPPVGPGDVARHLRFNPSAVAERWTKAGGGDPVCIIPYSSDDGMSLLARFCGTLFGHVPEPADEAKLKGTNSSVDIVSALLVNDVVKQLPGLKPGAAARAYAPNFKRGVPRLAKTEEFIATMLMNLVDGEGWDIAPPYTPGADQPLDGEAAQSFIEGLEGFLSRLRTAQHNGGQAVTRDFIVQMYRMLLDREPESSLAIEQALGHESRTKFRLAMISSQEFRQKNPQKEHMNVVPLTAAAIDVEHELDGERLRQLFDHIQSRWTKLGHERPHWSVLSSENYAGAVTPELDEQFFRTGIAERQMVEAILSRTGLSLKGRPRAVEYGCGIGRMSLQFAAMFDRVTAVDISPSHLELARQKAAGKGVDNIHFVLADVAEFGMGEPFDFWYSRIVLQHNPPPLMAAILHRALSLLAPGGIAIFQLPTYAVGYSFKFDHYLRNIGKGGDIEMHCLPQTRVFRIISELGCRVIEVREDDAVDIPRYWVSNMFVVEKLGAGRPVPSLRVVPDAVEHGMAAPGTLCPICGEARVFGGAGNYFSERDKLRGEGCPLGTCITRERAVAHVLMERFGRQALRSLSIHEAAPSRRSLSLWLSRNVPGYVQSGYFPKLPFGQMVDGLRNEDIERQTFADGSFDLVLHLDVLEHVFDPFAAIGECVRTLKAGGACVFTAPTYTERMSSEQVAFNENGALRIVGEPEYHGNPQDPKGGSLVTWRFGYDFARLLHEKLSVNVEVRRFEMEDGAVRGYMTEVYIVTPPSRNSRHG